MKILLFFISFIFFLSSFGQGKAKSEMVLEVDDYSMLSNVVGSANSLETSVISYSTFPNHQFTDINGVNFDVYSKLDQGKTVVLSFFNHYNTTCQQEVMFLNHMHDVFELQQNNTVFLAIEANTHSAVNLIGGMSFYNSWNMNYPISNIDGLIGNSTYSFLSMITNNSVPSYVVISPDKSFTVISEVINTNQVLSNVTQAILSSHGVNIDHDIDLYEVEHDRCDDNTNVFINVQNTGLQSLYGFEIHFFDSSNFMFDSITLPYILHQNFRSEISVFFNTPIDPSFRIEVEVSPTPEFNGNNSYYVSNSPVATLVSENIEVEIFDQENGEEIAWMLIDHTLGEVVDSAGLNGFGGIVGIPDGTNNYPLTLEAGHCYTFQIHDSFGDGLCCAYGNGYFKVTDNLSGDIINEGGDYFISAKTHFKAVNNLSIYDVLNEVSEPLKIKTIQYFDLLGRLIPSPKPNMITVKKTTFEDETFITEKIHLKYL